MKIAFHDNALSLRGTTIALYDYAFFSRKYWGVEPIILFDLKHPATDQRVVKKFSADFPVYGYTDFSQVDPLLSQEKCDYAFFIKVGENEGRFSRCCKSLIMAISTQYDPHGDVYAYCSEWLHEWSNGRAPWVGHMINLPRHNEDLRRELGIPDGDFVFGRTGGFETFDLPFVKTAVLDVLKTRKDIWFLFQYTEPFGEHERIIHLPPSEIPHYKTKFINTCDAMIHARFHGESFGIACGEFSTLGKRVVTFSGSPERSHIKILGDGGIYYSNYEEVLSIFKAIDKSDKNFDFYQEYTPERVMERFKRVYLGIKG